MPTVGPDPRPRGLDRAVAGWRHSLDAVLALGDKLTDEDWHRPTECPQWSVQDIYAHLVGGERWMAAGHPRLEDGIAPWAGGPVLARRGRTPAAVLAELHEVYAARLADIGSAPPDASAPAFLVTGQTATVAALWSQRAFDVWVHEQDVRRAVGRPGNLGSAGALVTCDVFLGWLPHIVAGAGGPPGAVVRVTVDGEVAFDHAVVVGPDGRGRLVAPADAPPATAHVSTDWESFARLSCGRVARGAATVRVDGDAGLADRVLANLVVAP